MVKQKEGVKRPVAILSILMIVLLFVASYVSCLAVLIPKRYDVAAGDVATQEIAATQSVEDAQATEAIRESARRNAETVYELDEQLASETIEAANAFFDDLDAMRDEANNMKDARTESLPYGTSGTLSVSQWQNVLSAAELGSLTSTLPIALSAEQGWELLASDDAEILRLQDAVLPKLTTSLNAGLAEDAIEARKATYEQEIRATSIDENLHDIGVKIFDAYLVPTFVVNQAETNRARENAALAVEPVMIDRGDIIVEEGDTITEAQIALLRQMSLVRADNDDLRLSFGVFLYMLALYALFAAYIAVYATDVFVNGKKMVIVGVAVCLAILLTFFGSALDSRIIFGLFAVMIVNLLVNEKVAIATNILVSLSFGLMLGGKGSSVLGTSAVSTMLSMLAAGQVAILALRFNKKRTAIIGAGGAAGIAGALVVIACDTVVGKGVGTILLDAAWAVGSHAITGVLVVGTLSLWENIFDVATSARLSELSSADQPLLRQLMTEAPGTYHHSMMVATLAENAAQAVGADPLLARVGSYYHDVGKLRRPLYFAENQTGENIHDTLPAAESATIIIAHQKDSVTLINKHRLPSAIAQIAFEHHGNTMAAYFYHKAVRESDGKREVMQKFFRYPGARPSSKESAIVFLADSCEAAVRSLKETNREAVEEMVKKVIKGKIDDNQLSASPLTFGDVGTIEQSFLRTFSGILHERVKYPGQSKNGKQV